MGEDNGRAGTKCGRNLVSIESRDCRIGNQCRDVLGARDCLRRNLHLEAVGPGALGARARPRTHHDRPAGAAQALGLRGSLVAVADDANARGAGQIRQRVFFFGVAAGAGDCSATATVVQSAIVTTVPLLKRMARFFANHSQVSTG